MECLLHCCDNTHDPIALPDGKDIIVGRLPLLKIKNPKCSRNQVQLTANYKEKEVQVKQLGKNPSSIGDQELKQGETSLLGPGGNICLLNKDYPHFIYFKLPPTVKSPKKSPRINDHYDHEFDKYKTSLSEKPKKRKIAEDDEEEICVIVKKAKSGSREQTGQNVNTDDIINKDYKYKTYLSEKTKKRKIPEENKDEICVKVKKAKSDSSEQTGQNVNTDDINKDDKYKTYLSEKTKKRKIPEENKDEICVKVKKAKSDSSEQTGRNVKTDDINKDGIKVDHTCNSTYTNDDHASSSPPLVGTPCNSSTWEELPGELLMYTRKGVQGRSKIAGFDMDGTLITTKSGRVFPTNTGDWKIALPQIPGKLKSLWSEGYKIVIFTNQNGIAKKKVSIPDFKKKIENVIQALCVPIQLNQGITVFKDHSYYIGDAAGRPVGWASGKKKDFSCSDRAFAANIGIKFQTPEEFFLNKKPAPFNMPAFDPKKLDPNAPLLKPSTASLVSKEKEVIVIVGYPACYVRVNRDSLGTWQKCVSSCRNALRQGKSVVVDNTNPDKESRKRYIDCGKEANIPARCFIMDVTKEHAQHNNQVRETLNIDKNYKPVGFMVYNSYKSTYVEPSCEEGFSETVRVQFKPKFKSERTKELYNQFL
ncbi:hypothetical protein QZH41_014559 [Actinostola sp. cb2023]|nr:hypothetical protein QZH41_014559 [Actinostola sp. cb2023]